MCSTEDAASAFVKWVGSEGILTRPTRYQVAEMARAFGAGAAWAITVTPSEARDA
jgi:hypothetical protein